jgi:hypothetical protein
VFQSFQELFLRNSKPVLVAAINNVNDRLYTIHGLAAQAWRRKTSVKRSMEAYISVGKVVRPRLPQCVLPANIPAEKLQILVGYLFDIRSNGRSGDNNFI